MKPTEVIYSMDLSRMPEDSLFEELKGLIEDYSGKLDDLELNVSYEEAEETWLVSPVDEALDILNKLLQHTKKSFFFEDCILFGINGCRKQFDKGNVIHI